MREDMPKNERLSSDEVALCTLLARIMRRCIAERDERIMRLLSSSTNVRCPESEATYESAA